MDEGRKNNLSNPPNLTTQQLFSQNLCKAENEMNYQSEKYKNLIKEMVNIKRSGISLNLSSDKTLYELMHNQTRFILETSSVMSKVYQIDRNEKMNDTRELFYVKNYTITPLIYETIINMCSPDEIDDLPLEFSNQKLIIFNHTNLLDKKVFENEYIYPYFNQHVLPILLSELKKIENNLQFNNKELWLNEFIEKIYKNIFIINYTSLIELLIKVQNLPNVIRIIKDVSLVIIDSPNLLLNQEIKVEHEDHGVTFKNKRRSSKNLEHQNIFEMIYKIINGLQNEFNFNLILTLYDYQRQDLLNYLKYKMNDQNFKIENQTRFCHFIVENEIEFIFQLNYLQDKHKIYSIEPFHSYYNINCSYFGYIVHLSENKYKLYVFKKRGGGEVGLYETKEYFLYDNKN
jgi:hypothetical protein